MSVFNADWLLAQGDEIQAVHFEDIRRLIYLLEIPNAGKITYDDVDSEDWAATYTSSETTRDPGYTIEFTKGSITDIFVLNTQATDAALGSHPPLKANGSGLDSWWNLGTNLNRYEDSDKCAGRDDLGDSIFHQRYIIRWYDSESTSATCKAYEWLPEQLGKQRQEPAIKDGGGITRQTKFLELAKLHLTYSLGMLYTNDFLNFPTEISLNPQGDPVGTTYSGGYSNINTKIRSSYQDQVQYVIMINGQYRFPVDDDFISMYEEYNGAGTYNCETDPNVPIWSRTDDTNPSTNIGIWGWFFQCNGSPFEKCLKRIGHFDWYWDTHAPHRPGWLEAKRDALGEGPDPDVVLPWPEGCWRRTWKWSFGGYNADLIWYPGSGNPPDYHPTKLCISPDTYDAMVAAGGGQIAHYQSVGTGSTCEPTVNLTEGQEATIAKHHDPAQIKNGTKQFEIRAEMVNDMWYALNEIKRVDAAWPYSIAAYSKHQGMGSCSPQGCSFSNVQTSASTASCMITCINASDNSPVSKSGFNPYGYLNGEIVVSNRDEVGPPSLWTIYGDSGSIKRTFGISLTYLNNDSPYVMEDTTLELRIAYKDHECYQTDSDPPDGYASWTLHDTCLFLFRGAGIGAACDDAGNTHYKTVHLSTPSQGDTMWYWAQFKTDWPSDWMTFTPSYDPEPAYHSRQRWSLYTEVQILPPVPIQGVAIVNWAGYDSDIFADTGKNFKTAV